MEKRKIWGFARISSQSHVSLFFDVRSPFWWPTKVTMMFRMAVACFWAIKRPKTLIRSRDMNKNQYSVKYEILLSNLLHNNMKTITYYLVQNSYIFRFFSKCRSDNNLVFSETIKLIPSYGKKKNMRFCQHFVTITRFVIFRCHSPLLMTKQGYYDVAGWA